MEDRVNLPWAGGSSLTRAKLTPDPRSAPNHGFARAPLAALRVVATSSVGSAVICGASGRVIADETAAQPPNGSVTPSAAAPRSTPRLDTASVFDAP